MLLFYPLCIGFCRAFCLSNAACRIIPGAALDKLNALQQTDKEFPKLEPDSTRVLSCAAVVVFVTLDVVEDSTAYRHDAEAAGTGADDTLLL